MSSSVGMATTAFRRVRDRDREVIFNYAETTRHILIAGTCNQEIGQRNSIGGSPLY